MVNVFNIEVLDHTVIVKFDDPEGWASDGMGRCDMKNGTIHINSTMNKDAQGSTFMHELVHLIADMNSIELSEQSVDGLSLGLLSFIKNNANFVNKVLLGQPEGR